MKKFKYINLKKELNYYNNFWNISTELLPSYTTFSITRFNIKDYKSKTVLEKYYLTEEQSQPMLLDVLFYLQQFSPDLTFRRSCREGICGSCSMNINGINSLACLYNLKFNTVYNNNIKLNKTVMKYNYININPLPHMPIVKDLVVSFHNFYNQYNSIEPYRKTNLRNDINSSVKLIKKSDRALIDGIYECILCACCSASCPSYWWSSDSYLGPAVLLQAYRWILDPNDTFTLSRLNYLNDIDKLYKCHNIMNCSLTCPKNLKPAESITQIKDLINHMDSSTAKKYKSNITTLIKKH